MPTFLAAALSRVCVSTKSAQDSTRAVLSAHLSDLDSEGSRSISSDGSVDNDDTAGMEEVVGALGEMGSDDLATASSVRRRSMYQQAASVYNSGDLGA